MPANDTRPAFSMGGQQSASLQHTTRVAGEETPESVIQQFSVGANREITEAVWRVD